MPVGRWGWDRFRASFAVAGGWASVVVVIVGLLCAFLYFGSALWFDLAYWTFGRFAADRIGRPIRVAASIAVAVVVVAAISASGAKPTVAPTPSAAVVAVATATPSPETTPSASAVAPSSAPSFVVVVSTPTPVDGDDEADASPAIGASFSAGPTGAAFVPAAPGSIADRLPGEPDPALTPGALNPAVTQATIRTTICVSGWTATIRPPSDYTTGLKIEQMAEYGYSDRSTADYEEDHLTSLELGGSPTDPRNLWPEPYTASLADGRATGAHTKDGFETRLKDQVCSGTITLTQAQTEIGDHWVHAYYGIALSSATPTAGPTTTAQPTTAPTEPPAITPGPVASDPYADAKAAGATAVCADGTWSSSKTRSGACSGHGGVHWWTGNVGAAGPGAH